MGKNVWILSETRNQLEIEGESDNPVFSSDSNELGGSGYPMSSEMTDMMNSANIIASGSGSKWKHSSGKTMQNKRIIGATALATSIDDLVNSVKTQSKELTVNHIVGAHSYTIVEAVARLYAIAGLDPTDLLFYFGLMLMDIPNNQEMVMSILKDQGIIGRL
ncbi:hypothetical protein ACSBR2_025164 [Camellia fascicularis]